MHDRVGIDQMQVIDSAAWPSHSQPVNPIMVPQTEMKPLMVLGKMVHSPWLFTYLDNTTRFQFNLATNPVPVECNPLQIYFQPVVAEKANNLSPPA